MVSTTQEVAQNKSQEFIDRIKQHFLTKPPLKHVTHCIRDLVKCCVKGCVHLDLRPDNMLFGAPRPSTRQHAIWCTSTFDPTTCYLVHLDLRPDNMLFGAPRPSTRQHAIWCTSTFDPTTCYLVHLDLRPDNMLFGTPRPSTRQHAVWWTATYNDQIVSRICALTN